MAELGANKRIVLNTATIYLRLVLTLGVALFSTRYVLEALGETDFGLYNVIAGVVSMLSFIAATMATTTQRFISFSMGESDDINKLKLVVGSSLTLHVVGAVIVAVIVLIGGWLMIDHVLTIPSGKHPDAIFVLWSVSLGLMGTIISVPFEALLMAHENILFVSICQVINAIVKFGGALLLLYIDVDRLRVYAMIMATLPFILLALESWFCLSHYPESHVAKKDLRPGIVMKKLGAFAGWVMIGTTALTVRTQGVSILMNVFWGVVVNAANGVATQVNSTIQFFSTSITTSLRPQLVKSAGENNTERMMTLIFSACKYPVLLIALAGCPLIVAMPYVLSLWLKVVPEYTVQFCRLLIVYTMFRQLSIGLFAGLEAKGYVKDLHIGYALLQLAILISGYLVAKGGCNPQSIYMCVVIINALTVIYALFLSHRHIQLSCRKFLKDVLLRTLTVVITVLCIDYLCWDLLSNNLLNLIFFILISSIACMVITMTVGLNVIERMYVVSQIRKRIFSSK